MPWPEAVEDHVAAALGMAVRLRFATAAVGLEELTAAERAQLPAGPRRRDWLLGRAALKRLLGGGDTSGVRFPHRSLSLSHAGGLAVAAGVEGGQGGVGVDYEPGRGVEPRTARFFLRPPERQPGRAGDLLRLWTVKEALFKATPGNEGATLLDYETVDPGAGAGEALDGTGRAFRYASAAVRGGWLTVAVCDGPS